MTSSKILEQKKMQTTTTDDRRHTYLLRIIILLQTLQKGRLNNPHSKLLLFFTSADLHFLSYAVSFYVAISVRSCLEHAGTVLAGSGAGAGCTD